MGLCGLEERKGENCFKAKKRWVENRDGDNENDEIKISFAFMTMVLCWNN